MVHSEISLQGNHRNPPFDSRLAKKSTKCHSGEPRVVEEVVSAAEAEAEAEVSQLNLGSLCFPCPFLMRGDSNVN